MKITEDIVKALHACIADGYDSVTDFANCANVSANTISKYMRRETEVMQKDTWEKLQPLLTAYLPKDAKAILPPLEMAEKLERALYANEQTVIESLARIGLTSMRMGVIVGCGPEAPEYAAQYRAILNRLLAAEAKIPVETGWFRAELQRVRGFGNGKCTYPEGTGAYARLVNYPTACASLVCKIRNAEANAERAAEWRKSGRIPEDADVYGNAMRRALECRAFYATALALKIYRCEKGEYPETLDALVPEILDQLPCDPLTGMPFDYRKMPKGGFMLYAQRIKSVKRMLRITSNPRY